MKAKVKGALFHIIYKVVNLIVHNNPWFIYNREKIVRTVLDVTGDRHETILDVGCGKGIYPEILRRNLPNCNTLVGLDISDADISMARKESDLEIAFVLANAEALPFKDSAFDFAFAKDLLHHTDDPVKVIREIRRVARYVAIVEANRPNPIMFIYTKYGGHEHFTLEQFEGLFSRALHEKAIIKQIHSYTALPLYRTREPQLIPYHVFLALLALLSRIAPYLSRAFLRLFAFLTKEPSYNFAIFGDSNWQPAAEEPQKVEIKVGEVVPQK